MAANTPKKDMKETLRYKHMVARLSGLLPQQKEAALLQEIAKGSQWRMDAVVEAINTKPNDWQLMDTSGLLKQAAMFGRLATVETLCDLFGYPKNTPFAPQPVEAAFQTAVLHGRFKTADALAARGASAHPVGNGNPLPPLLQAVLQDQTRSIDYLLKQGADKNFLVYLAVGANSLKSLRHLVEKKHADVNYRSNSGDTPLAMAERVGNPVLKQYLLDHGAKHAQLTVRPEPLSSEALKGTAFETSFDKLYLPLILDAWKVPTVSQELKDALGAEGSVARTATGLDFTLESGRKMEWTVNLKGAEFIGRGNRSIALETSDARAMVAASKSRGWTEINVHGDETQRQKLWLEAKRQGLKVANYTPPAASDAAKIWASEQPKPVPPAPRP
ncbi:MAG TPA: ankyrin repeat domain-containing protein [Patescibacteria group bacterium]|nr:ankyrin repeat domain-containing protein [Patescibacteria group bacterium]